MAAALTAKIDVSTPSADYNRMADRWRTARDCSEGSNAIKAAGTRYLPPLAGHNPRVRNDPYWSYVARALFYNITARTVDSLVGMVFRRPPVIANPPGSDDLMADIDLMGRPLEDFSKALLREVMTMGRAAVLVDHTRLPSDLRPYFRLYPAEDILDVVEDVIGGAVVPIQVRLRECFDEPALDNEFETNEINQIRVLELVGGRYRQRVFREGTGKQGPWVEFETIDPSIDGAPIDFIPIWLFSTDQMSRPGAIEPPPLIDLMEVNLAHYRTEADYSTALHVAGVPTLFVSGMEKPDPPLLVGSSQVMFMPPPEAKAYYVSYGAEGAAAIRQRLTDLQEQAAFLGARMLAPERRGIEAAETAAIHRMGEISILASIANNINFKLTNGLKFLLEWALFPTPTDETYIALCTDFIPTQAQSAMLTAMVAAWQANALSHSSLWDFLRTGELVDATKTLEDEQVLIDEEVKKKQAADLEKLKAQQDLFAQAAPAATGATGANGQQPPPKPGQPPPPKPGQPPAKGTQ